MDDPLAYYFIVCIDTFVLCNKILKIIIVKNDF